MDCVDFPTLQRRRRVCEAEKLFPIDDRGRRYVPAGIFLSSLVARYSPNPWIKTAKCNVRLRYCYSRKRGSDLFPSTSTSIFKYRNEMIPGIRLELSDHVISI